ncbi:hypothetical protein ACTXT7_011812 [Hymenolepis weldensis]
MGFDLVISDFADEHVNYSMLFQTNFSNFKSGLVATLRSARSQINQLLKGTCTATANGFGLNRKSTSQLQPLLPLTIPRQGTNANQSRIMMKSGKPASLLLVALMILASATVVPLPGLENHPEGAAAAALKSDVTSNDQSVLSEIISKLKSLIFAKKSVEDILNSLDEHEPKLKGEKIRHRLVRRCVFDSLKGILFGFTDNRITHDVQICLQNTGFHQNPFVELFFGKLIPCQSAKITQCIS